MKNFFKMLFASTLGVFIAFGLMSILSFFIFLGIAASAGSSTFSLKDKSVLQIDLAGTMSDRVVENPFAALMGREELGQMSMVDVLSSIEKAKENDQIKGIYIRGGMLSAGTSSISAVRKALIDFKESGKFIVAYGGSYSQSAYYLASVADEVILNPQGDVDFNGLASTPTFYKGLLEKVGVKMEIFKVGTFKAAVEPYILDKMSDANRQQVESFTGSMWGNVAKDVASSRKFGIDQLNNLVNMGLAFSDAEFLVVCKIVDTLMYENEVLDYIKEKLDVDIKKDLNTASVSQMKNVAYKNKKDYSDKIAVLFAEGEITNKTSGAFNTSSVISDKEYVKELRSIRDDKSIKALVFRVNSPGGSAYMSEQIWKEVLEVKKVKPVVVSMGDYAASGGYYISCAADWIVAEPTTLTGSIGIFGMFPSLEGLYGKVGLSHDVVKTNTFADFGTTSRSMRADEKHLVQSYIERGYINFVRRCADGRGKTEKEIDAIAQGRVWTGEQALEIGLVDELGGLDKAIEVAAQRAKLVDYSLRNYPEERDFLTQFLEESMIDMKTKLMQSLLSETEFRHFVFLRNIESQDKVQAIMEGNIEF